MQETGMDKEIGQQAQSVLLGRTMVHPAAGQDISIGKNKLS